MNTRQLLFQCMTQLCFTISDLYVDMIFTDYNSNIFNFIEGHKKVINWLQLLFQVNLIVAQLIILYLWLHARFLIISYTS